MKKCAILLIYCFLVLGIYQPLNAENSGLKKVGGYQWRWAPLNIAINETVAYCANGKYGFATANIYDPEHPYVMDWIDMDGFVRDVSLKGKYAYIVDDSVGLSVINISDYNKIFRVAELKLDGKPKSVKCIGDYAFIAILKSGLTIVNIADPENLHIVSQIQTPGLSYDVKVSGNFAYIADGASGVQIIDVSDVNNPGIISSVETNGYTHAVDVFNNLLLIADLVEGVTAVNITNPAKPVVSGRFEDIEAAADLTIDGDFAYLVDRHKSVLVLEIRNPSEMRKSGEIQCEDVMALSAHKDYIYAMKDYYGIEVIHIGSKQKPKAVFSLPERGGSSSPEPVKDAWFIMNMNVKGNYLYATVGYYGLLIFDISDPENPKIAGKYRTKSCASVFVVIDDYAYVSIGRNIWRNCAIEVINISNPDRPKLVKTIKLTTEIVDMEIYEDFIYMVPYASESIMLMDIKAPEEPVIHNALGIETEWRGFMDIDKDYLFLYSGKKSADEKSIIDIYSLKSPLKPDLVGNVEVNFALDIEAANGYLYVFNGSISVFNITNISKPEFVTLIKGNVAGGIDIDIQNNDACIAGMSSIEIFDISEPASLTEGVKFDRYSRYTNCVEIAGDYIYTSGWHQGIEVVKFR